MARLSGFGKLSRRLVGERSRPSGGAGTLGWLFALLAVVGSVRYLANVYLAFLVGGRLPSQAGTDYLLGSLWLLIAYACSAGAARAYRTTSPLLEHPRFRMSSIPRSRLRLRVASGALLRPAVMVVPVLFALSAASVLAIWGPAAVDLARCAVLLGCGLCCFGGVFASLHLWRPTDRVSSTLEAVFQLALVCANPDVQVSGELIRTVLLGAGVSVPTSSGAAVLSLAALPAGVALIGAAVRLRRFLAARWAGRERRSGDPLLRLYRADLPVAILVVSYVVEAALVLASDMLSSSLLRIQLALFALRLLWYVGFAFRVEYRISDWRPAPLSSPRSRLLRTLRSAPIHALLCLAPLALRLAEGALARSP